VELARARLANLEAHFPASTYRQRLSALVADSAGTQ
jgi:hypothetical protein